MLTSINTSYDGNLFRSRLEARWAVFFNSLKIPYEYEKEGFSLSSGYYLPDFWLPKQNYWIEIKATYPNEEELSLCRELTRESHHKSLLFFGTIPNPLWVDSSGPYSLSRDDSQNESAILDGGVDWHYTWCECPKCGILGIEYDGRAARLCKCFDYDKGYNGASPNLLNAYLAARQARFEYGQSGIYPQ
jgi:hypothetical protein